MHASTLSGLLEEKNQRHVCPGVAHPRPPADFTPATNPARPAERRATGESEKERVAGERERETTAMFLARCVARDRDQTSCAPSRLGAAWWVRLLGRTGLAEAASYSTPGAHLKLRVRQQLRTLDLSIPHTRGLELLASRFTRPTVCQADRATVRHSGCFPSLPPFPVAPSRLQLGTAAHGGIGSWKRGAARSIPMVPGQH